MDDCAKQRLIEDRFLGVGLVKINTPQMVCRYNECLKSQGLETTALDEFSIDGVGWSPEITAEKKDRLYLCAGEANPMGVIITPDQRGKPICCPVNSFDWRILKAWFERHHAAVAEITAKVGIGLDFDNNFVTFMSPRDLVLVTSVEVRASAGGLMEAASHQLALVRRFESEPMAWFDPTLRKDILESAKEWGDLRYRRVDIPTFRYDIGSFYTRALGGVFVFRNLSSAKSIVVVEDQSRFVNKHQGSGELYYLRDPNLLEVLFLHELVESDPAWYMDHTDQLMGKLDTMIAEMMAEEEPEVNYVTLRLAQKRQRAAKYADKLPLVFHEIERLIAQLQHRTLFDAPSKELRRMLLRPHRRLSMEEREVVWKFICRMDPFDSFRQYIFDQEAFIDAYPTWPASKQSWIIQRLQEHYRPAGSHGGR